MESLITAFLSFIPHPNLPHILTKPPPSLPQPLSTTSSSSSSLSILNALENMINKFIDPPTRSSSINPLIVLANNFAPVNELPPTQCHLIQGTLPKCLYGAYLRNGPNPQFFPNGPYHFFDGDGMVHCLLISNNNTITLSSRFVKTYKFLTEQKARTNLIPNFFAGANGLHGSLARAMLFVARVINGQLDITKGIGVANTSLALFGNRLFALCESDLPYELSLTPNGDIKTLGRVNFNGDLVLRMTAHPKFDHETKEGFAFLYDVFSPYLTYFRFDSKGNKHKDVPIYSMKQPSYMHDFFITKKYAIFPDIQLIMDPLRMILKGESFLRFDSNKVSRVGIIPRYSNNEKDLKWFEVPRLNMLHATNAWDEINEDGNEMITIISSNISYPQNGLDRMEDIVFSIDKIMINLNNGLVSRQKLSTKNLELPVINSTYVGKKNKYVYLAVDENSMPKVSGVVKLDMSLVSQGQQDCMVGSRMYAPGCYGGEPFFVSRDSENPNLEEDDGYLVTFLHDENECESRFLVMDAKSPTLDVVALVKLPQRVPYGIHGLFVKDKDVKALWDSDY